MAVEAAHMFVSVTADVDKATRNLDKVNNSANQTGGFLKTAAAGALGFGAAMITTQAAGMIFEGIKGGAIDMNAQLETSQLQFETLMGNADKAQKHVAHLFDFAAKTPFETGPIIEASRLMETFGGAALDTDKNLQKFGDAAAATGQPINEVAFWMSRAYAAIQAGKPWGEAAQRLGEMGIVTPQTRAALEKLQASGAKGPQVWNALTGSLGKFGGAMEKQAGTFDGMTSTISDNVNMLLAKAFKPLFFGLKDIMAGFIALMASPGFNGALESAGNAIGVVFGFIGQAFSGVMQIMGPIIGLVGQLFGLFSGGSAAISSFADNFTALHAKALLALQGIIDWVLNSAVPAIGDALGAFAIKFMDWIGPAAEQMGAALPRIAENIINFIAAEAPVIAAKLFEFANAFIGWIGANVLPRLPGVLATVGGAIIGWIVATAPVVAAKMGALAQQLIDRAAAILPKLPEIMGKALGNLIVAIVQHGPGIVGQMIQMGGQLVSAFLGLVGQLVPKFIGLFTTIIGALPGVALKLASAALGMAGSFVSGFIKGMGSLPGKIIDTISQAFRSVHIDIGPFHISASGVSIDLPHISLPSFATGTWNVPHDMAANIHSGEMIIPKDIAERLRGGRGFGFGGGAAQAGAHGGGDVFVFEIGQFVGTQENIGQLSREVASSVRLTRPKRSVFA